MFLILMGDRPKSLSNLICINILVVRGGKIMHGRINNTRRWLLLSINGRLLLCLL